MKWTETAFQSRITAKTALLLGVLTCAAYAGAVWLVGPYLPSIDFAEDTGFKHYYWKLPEAETMARLTAWGGYLAHQVVIWGLIFHAQRSGLKYTRALHPVNVLALLANLVFIVLHLLQTYVWYDGLAQDVSILSAQGSVVVMLVLIVILEHPRRGLAFGMRAPGLKTAAEITKRYHGYFFSWAVIYTFWYHPMEDTLGHLLGTFYTLLIMLQGSLFFTRSHVNRNWTVWLELLVVIHGAMVAWLSYNMWPMFFFGFLAMFVVTQMHGLGWSRWLRGLFILGYIAGVVVVYWGKGFSTAMEIFRIPAVEYGLVLAFAVLITLVAWFTPWGKSHSKIAEEHSA
jgi:hypothetical protein